MGPQGRDGDKECGHSFVSNSSGWSGVVGVRGTGGVNAKGIRGRDNTMLAHDFAVGCRWPWGFRDLEVSAG